MTSQTPESKIALAKDAIDNLTTLMERKAIKLIVSDQAWYEILRMLRFYRYCVVDGCTPEASAERALAYIDGIKRDYQSRLLTHVDPAQNS